MSGVPLGTPKRKRGEDVVLTPLEFSFEVTRMSNSLEGSAGTRFAVAHRFKDLGLPPKSDTGRPRSRGVAFASNPNEGSEMFEEKPDDQERSAKRMRQSREILNAQKHTPADVVSGDTERAASSDASCRDLEIRAKDPQLPSTPRTSVIVESAPAERVSVDEDVGEQAFDVPQPVTPSRRRAGTPPLKTKQKTAARTKALQDVTDVVDPVRAALTWHDDEITIYDPNDKDDDGTGVNGIGFKPSPAIREVQKAKRRQQLTDWRRREESDARARRTQRRRGYEPSPSISSPPGSQGSTLDGRTPRKVRFWDAESTNVANATE